MPSLVTPAGRAILSGSFLPSLMARQSDGLWFDFTKTSTIFQDTSATTSVASVGDQIGRANDISGRGHNATQSTSSLRPTFQTSGAKFDGSDDNLLTGYTAGSGANFIVALVTVPGTIAATQLFVGATGSTRVYVGFSTSGKLSCGLGSDTFGTNQGSADYRGQEIVVGLTFNGNGNPATLFGDGGAVASWTQNGASETGTAWRLGSQNNAGTAANFFGGSIKKLVAGRQFLDLSTYLKIRSALLAA